MKKCRVCLSPHRIEYERERKTGRIYRNLSMIAKKRHGEKIRGRQFKAHFEEEHGVIK